jgi:Carboxypeptidase regulatory-like domain/TonB dependent receptor-like, beta-barrel
MRPFRLAAVALLLGWLTTPEVVAQQGTSAIRGRVVDQQQAVLAGVTIVVTHAENGTTRETVSGPDGTYLVPALVPGPYRVTAQLQGFSRLTQEDIVLRIGTTQQIDLMMRVGAVEENLTVTAEAPQVDLTTAQVGGIVSTDDIANLPNANGNFTGLIAILPGVVYNRASDGQSDSVTINGQPGTGIVYQLDGGSNNDDLRGGSAGAQTRPALESIQEFQVVTNQFDAEYGAALSGVVNAITKQGTNTYHGSAIGYFTNAAMTSRDIFAEQQDRDKPETQNMRYGGTFGGPIVRDKMHYFLSYEKQDRDEGRSYNYTTRPDMSFSTVQITRMQNLMGRVDHQVGPGNSYSIRYLWDHQPTINQPLGNPTIDTLSQDKDNDWTLVGNYNRLFGSTKLYNLRVALVHEKPVRGQQLYQETGDWTLAPPSLVFQSFTDQADINRADFRIMDSYGLDNTFSWFISDARGSHDLKFGSQYVYGEHFEEFQRFMNGAFRFFSDRAYNAADPFSYPEQLEIRVPSKGEWLSRTHSLGLYVQDKWQMTTNLTLNLGLRYDIHISPLRWDWNPMFNDPGAYPIDKNNVAPRVGFAYNIANRSVVRGGYGLFFEKQYVDRFNTFQQNPVFTNSYQALFPADNFDPGPSSGRFPTHPLLVNGPVLNRQLVNQYVPPGSIARNTGVVWLDNPDRLLGYANQVSLGYERMLGQQLSLSADYTHMANRKLPIRFNLNPGIKPNTGRTTPVTRTDLLGLASQMGLSPFLTDVYTRENIGYTDYDGLSMQLEKRFSNYWAGRVGYTVGYGRGNGDGTPTAVNNFQVLGEHNLELNEGPTSADRRHVVSMGGRVEVPWVRGLIASVTTNFSSGTPFTIHNSNVDADRNGVLVDPVAPGTYSGTGQNAVTAENEGGRNGARGPGYRNVDMRVGYRVRNVGQGRTLDVFMEAFNVLNDPNFANPTGDMRSGSFLVPDALQGGGFPRQFQLGARFGF